MAHGHKFWVPSDDLTHCSNNKRLIALPPTILCI